MCKVATSGRIVGSLGKGYPEKAARPVDDTRRGMNQTEVELEIGDTLDRRYRIVSDGAAQDIGTRYSAYDVEAKRLVDLLLLASRFGTGIALLERLNRANQAVADLAQAELVPYEQIGLARGQIYLVHRHLEGQTLSELLTTTGFLDSSAVVNIASQVCNALAPAHRAGIAHGGLSPHSVVIGGDGQALIVDTGLVPALRPVPAPQGQPWGRFPYTSPEQAAGEEAHQATDVYLIGSLLYEMLTGRAVFVAADETGLALQHLRQDPVPLQARVPQTPPPLAQIVHKALAKEPALRYRNAGQLAHILHSHFGPRSAAEASPRSGMPAEQLTVPAPPLRPAARPQQRARPRQGAGQAAISTEPAGYDLESLARPTLAAEEWAEEPARWNWVMVGLLVAALIAVLGLIPLWRTVYQRYALPEPAPTPSGYWMPDEAIAAWSSPDGRGIGNVRIAGGRADSQIRPVEGQYEYELEERGYLFACPAGCWGDIPRPYSRQ